MNDVTIDIENFDELPNDNFNCQFTKILDNAKLIAENTRTLI